MRRRSASQPHSAPTFSKSMVSRKLSAMSDAPSITRSIAVVLVARNLRIAENHCISTTLAQALSRTAEHVGREHDHTFHVPVGTRTQWRTCQPFEGCCGRHGRHRRRCEARDHKIEAPQNRSLDMYVYVYFFLR